ncbi:MAG: hypothetical protein QGG36_29535 [Pirellulaceae bacterium]|nr:hypothetical protein [Pirellulaceae bacterium]
MRERLSSLKTRRQLLRRAAAGSALVTAAIVSLLAVFAIDFLFELPIVQRLVVLALVAGAFVWVYLRYAKPYLGVAESVEQLALQVESRHGIASDLIASLQFETTAVDQWGSETLKQEVVRGVVDTSKKLNVFHGFDTSDVRRRMILCTVAAAVGVGCVAGFPAHARVFFNRLMLGGLHYPTQTEIARVTINGRLVLKRRSGDRSRPAAAACPQGHPLEIIVQCGGVLPDDGLAELTSATTRQRRSTVLQALSDEQRLERLQQALDELDAADDPLDPGLAATLAGLVHFDAPRAAAALLDPGKLSGKEAHDEISSVISSWPSSKSDTAVYRGYLSRLVEPAEYQLFVGDAWTDSAKISLIPLPVVELKLLMIAPEYARTGPPVSVPMVRQVSVVAGSEVQLQVHSANGEPLERVWVTIKSAEDVKRVELAQVDRQGVDWQLAGSKSPFADVREDVAYEIQVRDKNGFSLEAPLKGVIRIRPDRAPTALAETVHRVVLPAAQPLIGYRVNDDFGIAELKIHAHIQRGLTDDTSFAPAGVSLEQPETGPEPDQEVSTIDLIPRDSLIRAEQLPLRGEYSLDLSPMKLVKGDRLRISLEVIDARGKAAGESAFSDPIYLEISDESGVLAAISESDEKSEKRISDLIKRQLGIGDSQ